MADASPRFWNVLPDIVIGERMLTIGFRKKPPTLTRPGFEEAAAREAKWFDANTAEPVSSRLPPGEDPGWALRVEEPDFAPDFLPIGPNFVSARLRAVMEVDDAVQWLPVDMTGSTALAKAQDYRVLRPLVTAPVLDLEAADGKWVDEMGANGVMIRRWTFKVVRQPDERREILRWRADVTPDADIFLESHALWLLATDALKQRVEAAGVTGIGFMDYRTDAA